MDAATLIGMGSLIIAFLSWLWSMISTHRKKVDKDIEDIEEDIKEMRLKISCNTKGFEKNGIEINQIRSESNKFESRMESIMIRQEDKLDRILEIILKANTK